MRKWRTEKFQKPGGTYWTLSSGKDKGRVRIALKYISAERAALARDAMQAEEDAGTVSRVLAMHAKDPQGAIDYLMGDSDDDLGEILPASTVNYGRMALRDYQRTVYAPRRAV